MIFTFLFTKTIYQKVQSKGSKGIFLKSSKKTEEKKITLSELVKEYKPTTIFFGDDFGYVSTLMSFKDVQNNMNKRTDIYYEVNVSGSKMTIYPKAKLKKEIDSFISSVQNFGALD